MTAIPFRWPAQASSQVTAAQHYDCCTIILLNPMAIWRWPAMMLDCGLSSSGCFRPAVSAISAAPTAPFIEFIDNPGWHGL